MSRFRYAVGYTYESVYLAKLHRCCAAASVTSRKSSKYSQTFRLSCLHNTTITGIATARTATILSPTLLALLAYTLPRSPAFQHCSTGFETGPAQRAAAAAACHRCRVISHTTMDTPACARYSQDIGWEPFSCRGLKNACVCVFVCVLLQEAPGRCTYGRCARRGNQSQKRTETDTD